MIRIAAHVGANVASPSVSRASLAGARGRLASVLVALAAVACGPAPDDAVQPADAGTPDVASGEGGGAGIEVPAQPRSLQASGSVAREVEEGAATSGGAKAVALALGTLRVGANYTDLGLAYRNADLLDVYMPHDLTELRSTVAADLTRLANAGINNVRVWAETTGTGSDLTFLRDRIAIIAQEAAARGIEVTVSLLDVHRTEPSQPDTQNGGFDAALRQRYQAIVGPNCGQSNVLWSIGNEIAGPNDPTAFANWYSAQVVALRSFCSQARVVAEVVPGSVNHFEWDGRADAAARKIINASNLVSVHYYGDASDTVEFRSLSGWLSRAGAQKFTVGEVGVCTSPDSQTSARYSTLRGTLDRLRDMGVRSARIWQLLKDEGGHIDNCSFESFRWDDITPSLRQDGFLPGGSSGACNTAGYPQGSWNACIFDGTNMNSFVASESWANVNADWGGGGPQGRSNSFSVEARTTVCFAAGNYRFHTVSDDGVQLFVNNSRLIDNWTIHGAIQNDSGSVYLNGCVPILARYFENEGGAVFRVWWDGASSTACNTGLYPQGSWNACVFDGTNMNTFAGNASWPTIDYDWGGGGPLGRTDNYSVEARRTECFAPGNYQFHTTSDDGIQLYVNGGLVINNWSDHAPTPNDSGVIYLNGCVPLLARYYERSGGAVFRVGWNGVGASCACKSDPNVNNFCHYAPGTPGCSMTFPGGYCDPNGDRSYTDGDWLRGYYEYAAACPR